MRKEKGLQTESSVSLDFVVVPSGESANKFNEHLELILDFMGVLEHEPELWERIRSPEKNESN